MNENGNKYALAALKNRRAGLSGEVIALRRKLTVAQEQLRHLDATIRIFDPGCAVGSIPSKRPRRVKLFKQGELSRMILDALRRAGAPLSTAHIIDAVVAQMGADPDARRAMAGRVRGNLAYHERRGSIVKTDSGLSAKWALAQ